MSRLEEIKMKINTCFSEDYFINLTEDEAVFLLQQSEEKQELEEEIKDTERVNAEFSRAVDYWKGTANHIEQQNKRYEETIKYIKEVCLSEAESCNFEKSNEENHKVNRVFFNGKERAYNHVESMLEKALQNK